MIGRIDGLGLQYIAGVKMRHERDVREIVLEDKSPFGAVCENLRVKTVELGNARYIVCVNEEEARRDKARQKDIVASLREKIASGCATPPSNPSLRLPPPVFFS